MAGPARRHRDREEAAQRLAGLLGVDVSVTRPLARAGVRELADMALWELADLEAVPHAGQKVVAVLVPALRAVGVDLPGASMWPAYRQSAPVVVARPVKRPILSCPDGHPVRHVTEDELVAAVLDPEWIAPDVEDECLFCGPGGRARDAASAGAAW